MASSSNRLCVGATSASAAMAAWTSAVMRVVCRYFGPPWTMRWPMMSTGPGTERSAPSSDPDLRAKGAPHSGAGGAEGGSPWISSRRHLKLLEPPLIARIFMNASSCARQRPLPVADIRQVFAVLGNVQLMFNQFIAQHLLYVRADVMQARHPVDHIAR